jgi:hypothetical protein
MWVGGVVVGVVFVIALNTSDVNMPIPLGGIYYDVTDFGFIDKTVKLSRVDGYGPLLCIRECLSNPLLKSLTIDRKVFRSPAECQPRAIQCF